VLLGHRESGDEAVIFDEAHRAARLKLIPTMVKECRKYGTAFVLGPRSLFRPAECEAA
jgi:hypothetical protein